MSFARVKFHTIWLISLTVMMFLNIAHAAAPVLQITLAPDANFQTVYNFSYPTQPNWVRCDCTGSGADTNCENSHDFPDNPIRPFMGPDGNVWLWASNAQALLPTVSGGYGSYIKEANATLSAPAPGVNQCTIGFEYTPVTPANANEQQSLASLNNLHWLLEFWAQGVGRNFQNTVLLQNDFHGNTLTDCGTAGLGGCRYTNLVMATWGNSQNQFTVPFTPVANAGVTNDYITSPLFVTPYLYYPQIGEQGVNAQTNILYVKNPGDSIPYYYILVNQNAPINTPPSGVSSGLCLFRTNNINDPNSWVGWDGSAFTVKFNVNPYVTPIANPKNCAYVLPSPFRYSLSYDPQYKTFIAMGVASVQPDPPLSTQKSQSQVIYATTQDLTDWGHYPKPTNYIYPPSAVMWNYNGGVNPSYVLYQLWSASLGNDSFDAQGYFGLIDPTSSSISRAYFGQSDNNFQFVGSNPYLYMVYFHAKINPPLEFGQTMKDVDRLPLTITCTANCAGY